MGAAYYKLKSFSQGLHWKSTKKYCKDHFKMNKLELIEKVWKGYKLKFINVTSWCLIIFEKIPKTGFDHFEKID